MPTPLKGPEAKSVEAMFARISRRYDFLNTAMTLGMHRRWKRQTATIAAGKDQGPRAYWNEYSPLTLFA